MTYTQLSEQKQKLITQEYLKSILHYNPETGVMTWKKKIGARCAEGQIAGVISKKDDYCRIGIKGKIYTAHRLAFLYMDGEWPKNDVDHINRVKSDNRWENLRHATKSLNGRNRTPGTNCASGIIGVSITPSGKWRADICVNYKQMYLGYADTIEEAAQLRKDAEVKYWNKV